MDGEVGGGGSQTQKVQIQELLTALGITRVVNVDDDHAQGTQQSKEEVLGAIRALSIDMVLVARLVLPDSEDEQAGELSQDEVLDMISASWDDLTDSQRDELTQAALRAQASGGGPVGDQPQDVAGNNAALLALPELLEGVADFRRMSLADWRAAGEALLDDQVPTLLLFDRSFEREGGSATAGDDLVRGILARDDRDHVHVGLLTHTAADEGRENDIAAEITDGLATSRPVIVVAKRRLQDQQFPQALRLVLFASEIEAFRLHAVESLNQANSRAIEALKGVDRYLLLAAFEAAREEGLYETDYAMRIAATFARKSLAASLRDASFVDNVLKRLRDAGAVKLYLDGVPRPAQYDQVQWDEQFEDGKSLASLALPLDVGDIFKFNDLFGKGRSQGKPRYYILLTQACDLSVRSGGQRSNDLTRVVLTELKPAVKDDQGDYRPLKSNQADLGLLLGSTGDLWRVQFARQIWVPVLALDACVTSANGHGVISGTDVGHKSLPASWIHRHTKMQAEVQGLISKFQGMESALETVQGKDVEVRLARRHVTAALLGTATKHSDGLTATIDAKAAKIEFGVERLARVSDTAARGLLSLLLQHQSRPAFDGKLLYDSGDVS